MASNIFSTYRTGENRVTASFLAVLRSLSLGRAERLIGALLEQSEFELVRFENQIAQGGQSVPDGLISSSCQIWLETKTKPGAVRTDQLRNHLQRFGAATEKTRMLLVLTPDERRPSAIDDVNNPSVTWASFAMLDQAIDELLNEKREVVSEREAFLLRELQTMFLEERLIGSTKDVLVVPARNAWPEYCKYGAYVCQASRPFQRCDRMAFYAFGEIKQSVPKIIHTWDSIQFTPGQQEGWLGRLVDVLLQETTRKADWSYKVFMLSEENDPSTITLAAPVSNDLRAASGRPVAFTQSQRYVSLDRLITAKVTSNLI